MITRRAFLKLGGASVLSLYISSQGKFLGRVFAAPISGGTLDPLSVPKYQTPMSIPPTMPRARIIPSDGYPEAWYLPDTTSIPAGYATEGTWYDYFAGKALTGFGETWGLASPPASVRTSTGLRPSGTTTIHWA